MAVTKIWDIHGDVSTVIRYTANKTKTWNEQYGKASMFHRIDTTVGTVMEYTADEMKTEKQLFVTGINCSQDTKIATEQFYDTKRLYKKEGGIVCFHAYQSFATGEVTAEQAHEIGVQLARELWGDRFEVLVSTHCNTDNYHNHFVINSVSFADGLRYYDNKETYRLLRETSDRICKEHHLSVIDSHNHLSKRTAGLETAELNGKYTIRQSIKDAIDLCIAATPYTFEDFVEMMTAMGFTFERRGSFLRVRRNDTNKFWRLDRLGDTYRESDIKYRIREQWRYQKSYGYTIYKGTGFQPGSLQKLYYHYCYLLGIFPKSRPQRKEVYEKMCEDKGKIEKLQGESRMLADNHINNFEQLEDYYRELVKEYEELSDSRRKLRNSMRRMTDDEEKKQIQADVKTLSERLFEIRKQKNYCIDIANNSAGMEAVVRLIEFPQTERNNQNEEREVEKFEYNRRSR